MSSFHQILIGGYPSGGLMTDRKPMLLPDQAFSKLQNAYVWRDRTRKRLGIVPMGQLRRVFNAINFFITGSANWTFNILTRSGYISGADNSNPGQITTTAPHGLSNGDKVIITGVAGATGYNNVTFTITVIDALNFTIGVNAAGFGAYTSGGFFISNRAIGSLEPYAQIAPRSFSITFSAVTYIDNGSGAILNGLLQVGTINYVTGSITLTNTGAGGVATSISYQYYPNLQSMGIWKQDIAVTGIDQTIFFDTKYAYQFVAGVFQELVPGTTWSAPNQANGTNTDFFWSANYQGTTPNFRFFFTTNNYINPSASLFDPIRYYDPSMSTWTDLSPAVDASNSIFQTLLIVPYYGRLLFLNTWEGTAVSPGATVNYFSRCRFSQIGDPTSVDAWRSDQFGKGGFLDAPTNEAIVGAAFYRNTLIVFFEYSTWQLRYIGEYGLPFIFERVSSDFGSVSTFSTILFDQGVMAVSDRGVIQAGAQGVVRLDDQIPDTVFSFEIQNNGPDFVHGVRDFEKEVVYWNYLDSSSAQKYQNFPTTTLLFNYKNNTWAQFRDTITCFGTGQFQLGITWDSQTTLWDDGSVYWDNSDDQEYVEYVLAGNQQGFISVYEDQEAEAQLPSPTDYGPSLSIYAVDFTAHPTEFTVPNHNLANGEIIYITEMLWKFGDTDPGINDTIYNVTVVDQNTIMLGLWNGVGYTAVDKISSATYIGGGLIALFPKMNIVGKDFNPFQGAGKQFKLSYIDFQMDSNTSSLASVAVTIQLFVNSAMNIQANLPITNQGSSISNQELSNTSQAGAQYAWYRFYSTQYGQYLRAAITYDDELMNQLSTHQNPVELNAMNFWFREGGRLIN